MFLIALRNLWEHKLRTALLGVAIVGGVAFVVASFVFTDSLSAAFDEAFANADIGSDIVVQAPGERDTASAEPFAAIPVDLRSIIESVEGVSGVTPSVEGFATIVDPDADDAAPGFGGPPSFALSWSDAEGDVQGAAPGGPGEVVVDAATAEDRGWVVGDTIQVAGIGRAQDFEIVGIFTFGEGDFGFGAAFLGFEFSVAADLLGLENSVTGFEVDVADEASVTEVVDALNGALGSSAEAVDARRAAQEQADQLQQGIGFFNTFLLVFAGISLIVGSFVVYNAFRVVVAQRSKELALLRLLGTTRRQLVRSVLGESMVVGFVASLVGVGAGTLLAIGVRGLLSAIGGALPESGLVLSPRTVLVGVVVGMTTTLVSALLPAWRTSRITPMEALRDQPELRRVRSWWSAAGGLLLAGALGLVIAGVVQAGDTGAITGEIGPIVLVGAGCLLTFGAVFILARTIARPLLSALGAGARSMPATIARENARRTPRRTAVTASALMVGVGLVATVAVLSRSVQDTIFDTIDETFTADLVVYAGGFDPTAGFPTEVADDIDRVDGVAVVARNNYLSVGLPGGGDTLALGVQPDTIQIAFGFDSIDGSLDDLGPDTFAVQQVEADTRGWDLGQEVEFTIEGEPYPAELVAIFDYVGELSDSSSYYLDYDVVAGFLDRPVDGALSIKYEQGRNPDEMRAAIESAIADFPTVQVQSATDLADQVRTGLNAVVGLVAGLLVMSVVVAVIGIVLTLYLAVFERTRETGMLRAIGMTKKQIRKMIRFESVLIAVFGTILGLGIGMFCGWALSIGIAGSGVSFGIPWGWIVAALVGALVTGVLAAIIPAYSATRMDVLQAIAYE